jgi:hypothetical protein
MYVTSKVAGTSPVGPAHFEGSMSLLDTTALYKAPPVPRVIPWLEWVKLRGISLSTAERLQRAGKVKVTYLSARRKGVREDHDREYLDSCARGGA